MAEDNDERNMAEAVVEQSRNRFYCHQCSVEINPTLPAYTCPQCDNGFIEEIAEDFESRHDDDDSPGLIGPGQGIDFGELWGQRFLDSFRQHASGADNPSGGNGTNSAPEREAPADSDDEFLPSPPPDAMDEDDDLLPGFMMASFPQTHTSIRFRSRGRGGGHPDIVPLQSLIGQLLSGLSGGPVPVGGGPPLLFGNLFGGGLHGNPGDYAWGPGGLDAIISQLMNQLEGSGPPAASKEQMDKLPTTQISKEQLDNGAQCSVCMEDFALDETVRQLPCQHCYHTDCIIPWLKIHGTCPVCRKTLDGQDTSCQEQGLEDAAASIAGDAASSQGPSTSTTTTTTTSNGPSTSSQNTSRRRNPPRNPPPPRDFESEYD